MSTTPRLILILKWACSTTRRRKTLAQKTATTVMNRFVGLWTWLFFWNCTCKQGFNGSWSLWSLHQSIAGIIYVVSIRKTFCWPPRSHCVLLQASILHCFEMERDFHPEPFPIFTEFFWVLLFQSLLMSPCWNYCAKNCLKTLESFQYTSLQLWPNAKKQKMSNVFSVNILDNVPPFVTRRPWKFPQKLSFEKKTSTPDHDYTGIFDPWKERGIVVVCFHSKPRYRKQLHGVYQNNLDLAFSEWFDL